MPSLRARWTVVCLAAAVSLSRSRSYFRLRAPAAASSGRVSDPSGAVVAGAKVSRHQRSDRRQPRHADQRQRRLRIPRRSRSAPIPSISNYRDLRRMSAKASRSTSTRSSP